MDILKDMRLTKHSFKRIKFLLDNVDQDAEYDTLGVTALCGHPAVKLNKQLRKAFLRLPLVIYARGGECVTYIVNQKVIQYLRDINSYTLTQL